MSERLAIAYSSIRCVQPQEICLNLPDTACDRNEAGFKNIFSITRTNSYCGGKNSPSLISMSIPFLKIKKLAPETITTIEM